MIDRLLGYYAGYKYSDVDKDYRPERAIESSELFNEDGARLTVLFPPWRGGEGMYDRLTKRLVHDGSAVLRYKLHPQILEAEPERVLESFNYIQHTVAEQLEAQVRSRSYEKVGLAATSLGNVSLALVARTFTGFDSATLIVPGSNLARCTWEGSRTQPIRQVLETTGIDEAALETLWKSLAPKAAAPAFEGKKIRMVISATDEIIPADYQEEMARSVLQYVPDADIVRTHLGHIVSVVKYCVAGQL